MEEEVSEKPLHVQVAEAFGCTPVLNGETWECGDYGHSYSSYVNEDGEEYNDYIIPRYDTDWAVTGPLIEKYVDDFCFNLGAMGWCDHYQVSAFGGRLGRDIGWHQVRGETPLLAVCVLILTLKAKGKL